MKAAVFHSKGDIRCDNIPDAEIKHPRDAILRVTSTAICGSDLHIYDGMFPQPRNMTLGHEFMGIVEDVGSEISNLKKGDRVVVPFPIACGQCHFCRNHLPTACEHSNEKHYGPQGGLLKGKGGGLFGYTDLYGGYEGGQAEAVRVPYADVSPRIIPEELSDDQVLFLTDIFPTGWTAIDWAELKGGETVAVFGCGPVGLMAQKSAWLQGAGRVIGIDVQPYRLEMARRASNAEVLDATEVDVVDAIREMTGGRGADVCVDAVGMEPDRGLLTKAKAAALLERGSDKVLTTCLDAVRRGGTVTVVGVYGMPYREFPLHQMFDKAIRLRLGQAPVQNYIDDLLRLVADGKVVLDDIITHHLPLEEVSKGYKMFRDKKDDCVKVVLKP